MGEKAKKRDRIKKYEEVFEAYALLDVYRKKQPTLEEASVRLEQYKGRVKSLGEAEDIQDEKNLVEVVNKIDHAELKIKNLGNEVFPRLENSMINWIDDKINEVAESKEEALAVKKFFEDGHRDPEMLIDIVDESAVVEEKNATKVDQMFSKIIDGLDSLIKEINNVLDSIDQALVEIEGKNSPVVELSSVEATPEEPAVETGPTASEPSSEIVQGDTAKESVESTGPVRLTMDDVENIMREEEEKAPDIAQMGSLFETFKSDAGKHQNTTTVKRQ